MYNAVYGTSYTSSQELVDATHTGWELIAPPAGTSSVQFWAVWRNAFMEQNFGYYQGVDDNLTYTELFSVPGLDPNGGGSIYIGGDGYGASVDGSIGSFGLYDDPEDPNTGKPAWGMLYSESMRNTYTSANPSSTWPSMDEEVHFLVLSTPNPNTYLIAVEDLPYAHVSSHRDFNDFVVEMKFNVVPEPATMMLLGMGLGGLAASSCLRKRRSASE
jgi:hypothetical protein